tara:strand:- start:1164 stop:1322 length:159 start_codon:yes stop_codon:yes gene_type:complete
MTTFIDTVLAIAFMEVILKPITIRITKRVLKWADNHIELIPDWLYAPGGGEE